MGDERAEKSAASCPTSLPLRTNSTVEKVLSMQACHCLIRQGRSPLWEERTPPRTSGEREGHFVTDKTSLNTRATSRCPSVAFLWNPSMQQIARRCRPNLEADHVQEALHLAIPYLFIQMAPFTPTAPLAIIPDRKTPSPNCLLLQCLQCPAASKHPISHQS